MLRFLEGFWAIECASLHYYYFYSHCVRPRCSTPGVVDKASLALVRQRARARTAEQHINLALSSFRSFFLSPFSGARPRDKLAKRS